MNQFIKNTLICCCLVGGYLAVNLGINYHRLTDSVNLEGTTLVMGDSHLRTSVDPSGLPQAANVCTGAESYIMTFYKMKKLFEDNPQIEQVLLGFSYNNFSAYQDLRLTGSKAKSQFSRYYEILPLNLPKQIEINDSKFYQTYVRELALYPNFFESTYLGGFQKHEPDLERADLMETINKHYFPEGEFVGISSHARPYLDSIIRLTSDKKIELILVATPLHEAYRQKVPTEIKDYFEEVSLDMKNQGIHVLDFMDQEFEDASFKDYDHLSAAGAKQFTQQLSAIKKP